MAPSSGNGKGLMLLLGTRVCSAYKSLVLCFPARDLVVMSVFGGGSRLVLSRFCLLGPDPSIPS